MDTGRPVVAVYFQMFSPYIIARLNAAAVGTELSVVGIEGSRFSAHYAWKPRKIEDCFRRLTLFPNEAIETIRPRRISSAVRAALDEVNPDVVVIGGWSTVEALSMLCWVRERGRRAVVMSESTAGDARRSRWREYLKRKVVTQFDSAIVGGTAQRLYIESLGMPVDRIYTGYDVVDNQWFSSGAKRAIATADQRRLEFDLPHKYFLASSRFIHKKNLPRLLDAFSEYRKNSGSDAWDLVLLGDGKLRSTLEAKARNLGLEQFIHFHGFRQYDVLPIYYGLAGAFVHLSTVEQWGLVINEAMAAGLPVIVSKNCGSARDLVKDGVNGFCVDPYDIRGIAGRLQTIAADSGARDFMGRESRQIIANYSPAAFASGLACAIKQAGASVYRRPSAVTSLLIRALAARGGGTGA